MKISVIVPTYNRASVLQRALQSVQQQSYPHFELCVVDDGSTDATRALVADKFPSAQYIYQENKGVSSARNLGVANTQGEWLAFLDSDDEWLLNKLAAQVAVIEQDSSCSLVHTDEIWIRNGVRVNPMHKHEKHGGEIFSRCLPLCAISPSSVLLRRQLFAEVGGFNESLVACEDYDLWLKICSRYPVSYIDTPLLKKYGGHQDQLSRQHWGMDRFRIEALENFIHSDSFQNSINLQQRKETLAILIEKCRIMSHGAAKRGKEARCHYYEDKISQISASFAEYL